ncbi:hypothetical protein BJF96_g4216 [Verticillium dahliae]|uniref:Uncharacterized protein n=1 Tax=Verticillium dahliae TaxID=27337 RepID=A0AA45AM53_VERDA|nr:hypothetical protein BJF96_g4216 [Verticillium dahliae]PNH53410.1 hypothetical protein VD0003_g4032 [Verticillium dahliae]
MGDPDQNLINFTPSPPDRDSLAQSLPSPPADSASSRLRVFASSRLRVFASSRLTRRKEPKTCV